VTHHGSRTALAAVHFRKQSEKKGLGQNMSFEGMLPVPTSSASSPSPNSCDLIIAQVSNLMVQSPLSDGTQGTRPSTHEPFGDTLDRP
jgi:hypothetical protein